MVQQPGLAAATGDSDWQQGRDMTDSVQHIADRAGQRRAGSGPARRIPPILHQTFKTRELPLRMHAAAMSWADANPAWDYRYHDNEACRALIARAFDARVLAAYDALPPGAFRADLWRYCALSVEGGVYADIDMVCRTDLERVLAPEDEFVVPTAGNLPQAVFNGFIASRPGHPFLARAIARATDLVLEAERRGTGPVDGYMCCGPGNLGAAMNLVLGRDPAAPHRVGRHEAGGLHYRILDKGRAPDGSRHVADGDIIVCLTKYEGYLDDLDQAGSGHWAGEREAARGGIGHIRRRLGRLLGRLSGRGAAAGQGNSGE